MVKKIMANVPAHVALIPDGNRRWARLRGIPLIAGYKLGIDKFIEFARWSSEFGIKTITVWGLSADNVKKRTSLEMRVLFSLYTKAARDKKFIKMLNDNRIRFKVIGDMKDLPVKLKSALNHIENETRKYTDFTINLLINYGGREDLIYSVKEIRRDLERGSISKVGEDDVRSRLLTASVPDVDLIVRTSGEMRLSGLLPWQTTYSELYFARKYWPEFEKKDFERALRLYSGRQRRYGK